MTSIKHGPGPDMDQANVAEHIRAQIGARGWTQSGLARRMAAIGHPMHQSIISRLLSAAPDESRNVTVAQLLGLSKLFALPPEQLLKPVTPDSAPPLPGRLPTWLADLLAQHLAGQTLPN